MHTPHPKPTGTPRPLRPAPRWEKTEPRTGSTLHHSTTQLRGRIDELAADIGRLRRRLDPETSSHWIGERIANHILTLDTMTHPTAAELAATTAPSDQAAITEAIRIVDHRNRKLRNLLGEPHGD